MKKSHSSKQWLRRHVSDPFVQRSKREGYRSRSAYKLTGIDERDKLIKPGMLVVDLGAAPGGWSQVAAKRVGAVHPTGAGDIFMVAYVSERAAGARPVESAQRAAEIVARALEERRRHSVAAAQSELPGAQ